MFILEYRDCKLYAAIGLDIFMWLTYIGAQWKTASILWPFHHQRNSILENIREYSSESVGSEYMLVISISWAFEGFFLLCLWQSRRGWQGPQMVANVTTVNARFTCSKDVCHFTGTDMLLVCRNVCHWLYPKLSFWQLPVQPMTNISSKWRHFGFGTGFRKLRVCAMFGKFLSLIFHDGLE